LGSFGVCRLNAKNADGPTKIAGAGPAITARAPPRQPGGFGLSEDMSANPIIERGASAAAGKLFIFR
jgi:hypothetical protein